MRKKILVLVFIASITALNANTNLQINNNNNNDCFTYACEQLGEFEEQIELNEDEADAIYDYYYTECTSESVPGGGE